MLHNIDSKMERIEKEIKNKHSEQIQDKLEKEIAELESSLKNCDQNVKQNKKKKEHLNEEIEGLKNKIKSLHSVRDTINQILANKEVLEKERQEIKEALYCKPEMARIGNLLRLDYYPSPNFNKDQVYGKLLNLFSPRNPKYNLPLEVIGGGSLFSVVVSNRFVSTQLLKEKAFKHFVSFIPLKEIYCNAFPPDLIKRLESKYQGKVVHALKVLDYKMEVERAIKFVFGSYFICESSQIAKNLIQEANVQCVTLEGDVLRSSGVVSGGYLGNLPRNIEQASRYKEYMKEINKVNMKLGEHEEELKSNYKDENQLNSLKGLLREKEEESKSLMMDSTQQKKLILSQIEMKKKYREDNQKYLEELERDRLECEEERERIKGNLDRLGQAGVNIHDLLTTDVEKSKDSLKSLEQKVEDGKMQITQNEKMIDNAHSNISKYRENLEAFKKELFGKLANLIIYYRSQNGNQFSRSRPG
jgi:structural maintenance of chromosome 2